MLSNTLLRTLVPVCAMLLLLPVSVSAAAAGEVNQQLRIVEPEAGSAFWSGAGEVTIRTVAQPPLQPDSGQTLHVYLDRERVGDKPVVTLQNVDRGTHEVYAEIVGTDGEILVESPHVRFTLHRPSKLLP